MPKEQLTRTRSGFRWALAFIALAGVQPLNSQEGAGPLQIDDLLNVREFAGSTPVEFSPDGKWVVYTGRDNRKSNTNDLTEDIRSGVPSYARGADVWLVSTDTHKTINLTGGEGANWSPAWSPDGRYLAFLSDRDNSGQAKVWVWQAATNRFNKVSDVLVRANKLEWMPNGDQVLTTVLPQDLDPNEYANRVLTSGSAAEDQQGAIVKGSTAVVYEANRDRQRKGQVGASDPWSLTRYLRDLALIDVRTSAVERLVKGGRISAYVVSANGAHVAFSSPEHFEMPGSQQILWTLSTVAVSSRQITVAAVAVRFEYDGASFSWSPDSLHLAYSTGGPSEMDSGTSDCYVVDLEGGPPRNVTKFPQQRLPQALLYKQHPPLWNANGQFLYFIRGDSIWLTGLNANEAHKVLTIPDHRIIQFVVRDENRLWSSDGGTSTIVITDDIEKHQSGFYKVGLENGHFSRLLENGQCYICVNTEERVAVHPKRNDLVYLSQDSQHYDDLWLTDAGFGNPRRLTQLNPQFDKRRLGTTRLVEWRSLDGEVLHGALLLPSNYEEGKRYPLIVWVYGGARGSNSVNHFGLAYGAAFNMQLLATRGYAVLFPDAPQHLGTPMIDLAKTVLPGVDKVIEMGIADADRLGVMGHSYGGYSALSLIVLTKRFKVAVIADGAGNLVGQYGQLNKDGAAFGTSITEKGQGLIGGTPWEFRDRYIENSPIFFLDRVDTPLLIVNGGEDAAVAPFLGDEVFVGLRRLGKEVEYAKYAGEGHSPVYWSYANQLDVCARVISWLDEHLHVTMMN
jgi:dipeptidyl aminopeptidase/acylaminoacyl peptidase